MCRRPSGCPSTDLNAHLYPVHCQHLKQLHKILDQLLAQNSFLQNSLEAKQEKLIQTQTAIVQHCQDWQAVSILYLLFHLRLWMSRFYWYLILGSSRNLKKKREYSRDSYFKVKRILYKVVYKNCWVFLPFLGKIFHNLFGITAYQSLYVKKKITLYFHIELFFLANFTKLKL